MKKRGDDFDRLKPEPRARALRTMIEHLLGPEKAARVLEQLEPGLLTRARQPGDARDPEKSYWRGAWRIHELDGPGDP